MASGGGGLIGAAGNGHVGAARTSAVGCSGTLLGSGAPDEELKHLGSGSPAMPHLELCGKQLDYAYPPLQVPQDEILEDHDNDANDLVYQSGLRVAEAIQLETTDHGRRRRMSPNAEKPYEKVALVYDSDNYDYDYDYNYYDEPKGSAQDFGKKGQEKDVADLVTTRRASLRSTALCRRRSDWGGLVHRGLKGTEEDSVQRRDSPSFLFLPMPDSAVSRSRARPAPLGSSCSPVDTAEPSGIHNR